MISGRASLSGRLRGHELSGRVGEGVRSVFRHFSLFIRSSAIGTVIGAIPGIGGSVAGFIAYGHASQSAADNSVATSFSPLNLFRDYKYMKIKRRKPSAQRPTTHECRKSEGEGSHGK